MHGTSQRTAYMDTIVDWEAPQAAWDILNRKFIWRLFKPSSKKIAWAESKKRPVYGYGYVTGTRRVVLDNFDNGGFYGSNAFRKKHHDALVGKLWKG